MAKLAEAEGQKNRLNDRIKSVIFLLVLIAVILIAFLNSYMKDRDFAENATQPMICVHVKGAVENSGLFYVPYGTRVNDLSEFVGGFKDNADLDGINLAAYVNDGEEIYIPYMGSKENGGYNLNTITKEELIEYVDGIGDGYAQKIIAYREARGGFESVSEIKGILGEAVYEKVRERFYIE